MITPDWARMMARHNAWQHEWMIPAILSLDDAAVRKDRGLFFGSILGTANHLLWGDRAWLYRFGEGPMPDVPPAQNTDLTPDAATWALERRATDDALARWADGLKTTDGTLVWQSALSPRENRTPVAVAVSHIFLHQVHHRGQIHAALTGLGVETGTTDLPLLPGLE
ncbi:MAG: DinB family protein [Pseudomonadota bacterium]